MEINRLADGRAGLQTVQGGRANRAHKYGADNFMHFEHKTVCQSCGCNCGLLAALQDGRVMEVKGDPGVPHNSGGICIKGKMSPRLLYAPDRLKAPLMRRRDGHGFMELSWPQALAELADRLERLKREHGPQSLFFYRGRSTRFIDSEFIRAFARWYGTPNVCGAWSICVGSKVIGYRATFGAPLFPFCDFRHAKLVVLWGTNPAASRMHRYFSLPNHIRGAVKDGAELVVIDPRRHRFAAGAHMHLAIRPGTDTYFILSLIKLLIQNGWADEEFIRDHATGYDELCASLADLDPHEAARICDIPYDSMLELARKLGAIKPAAIDRREGAIHQANGTQVNRALAILNAVTGNVDRPGGLGFMPVPGWNTSLGIASRVEAPPVWQERHPLAADGLQQFTPAVLEGLPYPIRALISVSGNPLSAMPATPKAREALAKLDLLVVNDLFMTESAHMADMVLPGVTFFEKGEFHEEPLKPVPWLQVSAPLVEPVGQARPEWRFMAELARIMGLEELSAFADEDQYLRRVFHDSGRPDLDPARLRGGEPFAEPETGALLKHGFNTPSGKIELWSSLLAEHGYAPLPLAEDNCACSPEYPFRLVTGSRVSAFTHSQQRNIAELRKLCPEPLAEIPPAIAQRLGLPEGGDIEIATCWGRIKMRAKVIPGMNPDTVSIPHGWPGGQNANHLTGVDLVDPISGTPAYKAIPCAVFRAEPEMREDTD